MNHILVAAHPAHAIQPARTALSAFAALKRQIRTWSARQRSRRVLLSFDDAALKDIGVSRAQANFEYSRPFWRD